MTTTISLFVVDDHALFREGLLRLLSANPQMQVVGSASSVEETLRMLPESGVDVLLVDYDLGGESALGLIRTLNQRRYAARVLLVTAGLPDSVALEMVRLGVAGIVHKQHSPEALQRSIVDVARGIVHLEQRYLQSLLESAAEPRPRPQLTDRERDVVRLLLEGLSNKEIGAELGLSESAVKSALQQLFAKTGVRTRSQLVRIALENPDLLGD